jgi:glycerol-3-phosphate acyltransferase PlsX
MLEKMPINFIGNIEARDTMTGNADVIVTDGFTGNIIIKLCEGVAQVLMGKVKNILTKNTKNKLAAAIILPDIKSLKKEMDYNEYGGAPVLGISRPVFKIHGNATSRTVKNAIKLTIDYIETGVINEIFESVKKHDSINSAEESDALG